MFFLLLFRVPRWNRNDLFLRTFVKSLLFFATHRASALGNVARDSTSRARRLGPRSVGVGGRGEVTFTCQPPTRAGLEYGL